MAKDKKLTKNWSIPANVPFEIERKGFNPKVFDNIDVGEKTKNDFHFLSMELFKDLNLPKTSTNDIEILTDLPTDTLEEKKCTLNILKDIKSIIFWHYNGLAQDRINLYKRYEEKSADLVTLQLMDNADEESISKVQSEIREIVQAGKNTTAETAALRKLLQAVETNIERINLSIEQSHRDIFASRLKQARTEARLTQSELADLTFTSQGAITSYEIARREPSLTTLTRLSEKLDVSTDWLLGLKD